MRSLEKGEPPQRYAPVGTTIHRDHELRFPEKKRNFRLFTLLFHGKKIVIPTGADPNFLDRKCGVAQ
jgi:hypothetical protein